MVESGSERRSDRRRSPSQDRSRGTVDCIKQAALELAMQYGFDAVTTARITERAGVSIGSVYQYFASRESVLLAIYEDVSLDLVIETRQLSDAVRDRDLNDVVEIIVERILYLHEKHRLILIDMPRRFPELIPSGHPLGYENMVRSLIKAFVITRGGGLDRGELETRVFFLERIMMDSIRAWLSEGPTHPSRAELVSGIAEILLILNRGPAR